MLFFGNAFLKGGIRTTQISGMMQIQLASKIAVDCSSTIIDAAEKLGDKDTLVDKLALYFLNQNIGA